MVFSHSISGKYITLRPIEIEDASFAIKLRRSEKASPFLHSTSDDIDEQIAWIEKQRRTPNDYYFVVLNNQMDKIGLIALYNINGDEAELGRWASFGNAMENVETILLMHEFGFDTLELKNIYSCTMKDNKKVINFWKRFGADYIEEIDTGYISVKNAVSKSLYYDTLLPRLSKLL